MVDEITLPVIEEEINVSKDSKVTARVAVTTETHISSNLLDVALASEEVEVTRVAVGRPVDSPPPVRTEGDVTIVPVLAEQAIVKKQLVLVEEIRIRKSSSVEHVAVPVDTLHQTVSVERSAVPKPQTERTQKND